MLQILATPEHIPENVVLTVVGKTSDKYRINYFRNEPDHGQL